MESSQTSHVGRTPGYLARFDGTTAREMVPRTPLAVAVTVDARPGAWW
jgi:hypothetical protein